jgi:hypothetical protein
MSRGPGRWQRAILATLEQHRAFFSHDLLPLEPTRAQQAALQRAVVTLHDKGKIGIGHWLGHNPAGRIVVYRLDGEPVPASVDHGEGQAKLAPRPEEIARLVDVHQYNT